MRQQTMGICRVGHRGNATQIDRHPYRVRGLFHLGLTHRYGFGTAQTVEVELCERLTLYRQMRQQLHPMPHGGNQHVGVLQAQQLLCAFQLALSDQTPWADEIEKHIYT
jgi:hypothetical protein